MTTLKKLVHISAIVQFYLLLHIYYASGLDMISLLKAAAWTMGATSLSVITFLITSAPTGPAARFHGADINGALSAAIGVEFGCFVYYYTIAVLDCSGYFNAF